MKRSGPEDWRLLSSRGFWAQSRGSSLAPRGHRPGSARGGSDSSHRGSAQRVGSSFTPGSEDRLGAPPLLGRRRGVGRGRSVPRPRREGARLVPPVPVPARPAPPRTLTDSCLQSLRLHLGLHPPQAPSLGTASRPPSLSRDLLCTALRRLKGQRPPRRAGAASTSAWHHRDTNKLAQSGTLLPNPPPKMFISERDRPLAFPFTALRLERERRT